MISVSPSWCVCILAVGVLASAVDVVAGGQQASGSADVYRTTVSVAANTEFGQGADPGGTDQTAGADGLYTGGQFTLGFGKRLRRVTFGASAAKSLRYYQDGGLLDLGDSAGLTVAAQFRRSRFTIGQTIRRMPFQQFLRLGESGGDPLAFALTSPELSVLKTPTTTLSTMAVFSRSLGRRMEVQARYGWDESRQGSRVDRRVSTFGGGIQRNLTRGLGLRLGNTVRLVRSERESLSPSLTAHDLDLGLDYHRSLSSRGRTSVAFSSGAAALTTEDGTTQYMMTGAAGLQHRIGRSWTATFGFDRRLNVIEGIRQPVIANTLTTTTQGLLRGRTGLRVRGSIMQGTLGVPAGRAEAAAGTGAAGLGTITTFTTEVRVQHPLWNGWQWYAEQFYYQHELSNPGLLLQGVPSSLMRTGVRTGVELQMALLRRRR